MTGISSAANNISVMATGNEKDKQKGPTGAFPFIKCSVTLARMMLNQINNTKHDDTF